ncbi:MAG: hypothetical protein HZA91_04855 [Verrucomicrobia bacterium]|nr:hypothetical protein [Verrucomicrobiota bacterium]
MKRSEPASLFCKLCGVRIVEQHLASRIGRCKVCSTNRGRHDAHKAENRRRVQVAGFLPANYWK